MNDQPPRTIITQAIAGWLISILEAQLNTSGWKVALLAKCSNVTLLIRIVFFYTLLCRYRFTRGPRLDRSRRNPLTERHGRAGGPLLPLSVATLATGPPVPLSVDLSPFAPPPHGNDLVCGYFVYQRCDWPAIDGDKGAR